MKLRLTLVALALACIGAPAALADGGGGGGMSRRRRAGASSREDPAAAYQAGVTALQRAELPGRDPQIPKRAARGAERRPDQLRAWAGICRQQRNGRSARGVRTLRARRRTGRQARGCSSACSICKPAIASTPSNSRRRCKRRSTRAMRRAAMQRRAQLQAAYDQLTTALDAPPAAPAADPATTGWNFPSVEEGRVAYAEAVGLINQERFAEALDALARAQAAVGPHPDVLNYMGFASRKLGRNRRRVGLLQRGAGDRSEPSRRQRISGRTLHPDGRSWAARAVNWRGWMSSAPTAAPSAKSWRDGSRPQRGEAVAGWAGGARDGRRSAERAVAARTGLDSARRNAGARSDARARRSAAARTPEIEIGRALFRTPVLFGGPAARAGLSCNACHSNGGVNARFLLPELTDRAGHADVTSEWSSRVRGDGVANPVAIPDLGGRVRRTTASGMRASLARDVRAQRDRRRIPGPAAAGAGVRRHDRLFARAALRGVRRRRKGASTLASAADDVRRAVAAAETADAETAGFCCLRGRMGSGASSNACPRARLRAIAPLRNTCARTWRDAATPRIIDAGDGRRALPGWRARFDAAVARTARRERRTYFNEATLRRDSSR